MTTIDLLKNGRERLISYHVHRASTVKISLSRFSSLMCGKYNMLPNLVLNSYLLDLRRHVYLTLPIPRLSITLFSFLNIQDLICFRIWNSLTYPHVIEIY